jgi:hypothetical protein
MHRFGRYRPRHQQGALILALCLAGCVTAPEIKTVVTVVEAPLPKPPAGVLRMPAELPLLPERPMPVAEFAAAYADLQARYVSETGRFRLLQSYVRKLRRKAK